MTPSQIFNLPVRGREGCNLYDILGQGQRDLFHAMAAIGYGRADHATLFLASARDALSAVVETLERAEKSLPLRGEGDSL